jgi:hypothetical protein
MGGCHLSAPAEGRRGPARSGKPPEPSSPRRSRAGWLGLLVAVLALAGGFAAGLRTLAEPGGSDPDPATLSAGATSVTAATRPPATRPPRFGPSQGRPFAARSPWNTPIPANPVLDGRGAAIAGYLGSGRPYTAFANLYRFGIPVYDAGPSNRRRAVRCTKPWGTCGLARQAVPIPAGARPSQGSDAAMIVLDWSGRRAYEFWQARRHGAGWVASWGEVVDLDGDGTGSGATGAGVPTLAGLVRTYEIEHGRIDHALVFSTDNACRAVHRRPATKTDGTSTRPDCIPQGARVQLDPSIDVDAIPGMTSGERAVARALQVYGAYCRDSGGARMAFAFQDPAGGPDPYPGAGLSHDYDDMPHIPWSRLRVLRRWDGR